MSFKKPISLCILIFSSSLFTINAFAKVDEVKNEFVSVFYTAASEYCYRDMATDGNFADLNAASDASLETLWSKLLVKGDKNNPPSELYIKRVGLSPAGKINEFGLLISRGSEIVNCDVVYPQAPAIFKARSNQVVLARELQELIFESSAWINFTVGDDLYERMWDVVKVTAINEELIKIELFYSSDPVNPFAVYEIPGAYHQAWGVHSGTGTVIYFTDEAGSVGSVLPGGILINVDTCALSAVVGYCDF